MKYKYHYVYRITNTKTHLHYYGSRSCDCNPTDDIGITYFSNSSVKLFIEDQKNNPQDYKYKIIKIFETSRKDATQLEVDLHKKFNVKNNPKFINLANQTSSGCDRTGVPDSVETRMKKSRSLSGLKKSEKHCKNVSKSILKKYDDDPTYKERISNTVKDWHKENENPFKGKKHSDETRKKMSENHADFSGENHPLYGKNHSDDSKRKMSEAKKGKGFKPHNSNHLLLISPTGEEFHVYGDLAGFCKEHNLGEETIRKIYKKGIKPVRKNNRNYGWNAKVIE